MPEESVIELAKRVEAYAKAKTQKVQVTKQFAHEFDAVAKHYGCSLQEIDLMREAVRRDTENAVETFHNLYLELNQERRRKPRNAETKTSVSGMWTYTDKI